MASEDTSVPLTALLGIPKILCVVSAIRTIFRFFERRKKTAAKVEIGEVRHSTSLTSVVKLDESQNRLNYHMHLITHVLVTNHSIFLWQAEFAQ